MLKDETGETTEADIKEMDNLQFFIDYHELFTQKFGAF